MVTQLLQLRLIGYSVLPGGKTPCLHRGVGCDIQRPPGEGTQRQSGGEQLGRIRGEVCLSRFIKGRYLAVWGGGGQQVLQLINLRHPLL